MFKLWSEQNNEAKQLLSPNLDLRSWDDLSNEEKEKMWNFLKEWFNREDDPRVLLAIIHLNEVHKFRSYARATLEHPSPRSSSADFKNIFFNESRHVVLECLSCFCKSVLDERRRDSGRIYRHDYDSDEEYMEALTRWRFNEFDKFTERINDVFEHFSINLILTRSGFIDRQDPKVVQEIYVPVLNFLSLPKWRDVNRDLSDAFKEYQIKTAQSYSNCITHAVSGVQAFLQILVHEQTGGEYGISNLIKQAQEKGLIPEDKFSNAIFKNVETILMGERGKTGDAHPKQEYANEKNARLVLNLIMIFIQHCIQK
ncbi:hypothetical protein HYW17_04680 [Candidatus Uhrbacteria bacterium]|nr:hypothetical protein [Candidatus Uhrbacteria bacterium]